MLVVGRHTVMWYFTLITILLQLGSFVSGHGFTHMSMVTTQFGRNIPTVFTQTGISLNECTLLCSLRPKCLFLTYERITGHCKLYAEFSADEPVLQPTKQRRSVIYVVRAAILSQVV